MTNVMDAMDGKRRQSSGRSRKSSVYVRLDPSIAHALADVAEAAGMSAAGWVRQRIVDALPGDHEIKPSPSVRNRVPAEDLAVVSQLSADISRMGGALVQLTKALRRGEHVSYNNAEATLTDLRAVQSAVWRVMSSLELR